MLFSFACGKGRTGATRMRVLTPRPESARVLTAAERDVGTPGMQGPGIERLQAVQFPVKTAEKRRIGGNRALARPVNSESPDFETENRLAGLDTNSKHSG